MEQLKKKLENSLHKGFIDQNKPVSAQFKPKLLTNKKHENVLSTLLQELKTCKTFIFSVAFITEGGLATLKTMLYDLEKKGIQGRILTSTFLSFNQPKMFKELLKLKNVEVRLSGAKGFHSKGYIFEHDHYYSLIVGSSNLTDSALKANFEWNVFLTSLEDGEVIHHFKNQFEEAWEASTPLSEEWITDYQVKYNLENPKQFPSQIVRSQPLYTTNKLRDALEIKPNKMQEEALAQLKALRASGATKGLIISATGTGKTYLSAFDVRNAGPKRMLFIVHREQILKKAMSDYRQILGGNDEDFGILSGNSKDLNARYLFATVQTISRDSYLQQFAKDHFDYVLIDEVHRAGADSYLKIINYFEPKFLLGMTATPERTDNFNIFELFDYNIAYEIRLQAALEEDMLCPFHYFGVTDYEMGEEVITETASLQKLIAKERVDHIIDKISYYGFSGDKVRGLMFCSSKEEARELSAILNLRGYKTSFLTGDHSQDEREKAIQLLEFGELEYILTVDIFNEGIDIPFINQIVMLRQTQSSIIFIQQLGRGLRKHNEKDYVTVIDFIGNYKNNFLIPIALSGDKTMNKDNVRRNTVNTDYIQGVSTVNFEEIAKKRIFEAINNTKNLTSFTNLKKEYTEIKNRIGRVPMLLDFIKNNSVDPEVIIKSVKQKNYYTFLEKAKEEQPSLNEYQQKVLSFITNELINGKRIHEIILLKSLIKQESISKDTYIQLLIEGKTYIDEETILSAENILTFDFYVPQSIEKYGTYPLISNIDNVYSLNNPFKNSLQNEYFKKLVNDVIFCALEKSQKYDLLIPFTHYQKYSRKDVCRLLNWPKNEEATLNGGRARNGVCPIFVNYHKNDENYEAAMYMDEFLSNEVFKWCSTKKRTISAKDMQPIIHSSKMNVEVLLFVKKDNAEGIDFYYLGKVKVDPSSAKNETLIDKGQPYPVVTMDMILDEPVQYDIYHYLVEE
ncbi:DEAD/DEAH box helicase [Lysinibacillus sp. 54212]|uniref:DEAD/DEAH box helicase n=1 Tax=Lysinibacillus sp. 54212 TaxID=3119829 RepID=UPI002FCC8223